VEREECYQVPRQVCEQVEKQVCRDVERQQCTQQCTNSYTCQICEVQDDGEYGVPAAPPVGAYGAPAASPIAYSAGK
jgi:hypothetical protein